METTTLYPQLMTGKKELIDTAFAMHAIASIADIGGAGVQGGVQGGYAYYAREKYHLGRAFIVDGYISGDMIERTLHDPSVTFVLGQCDSREILARIGQVDCVFLFDFLLHQVQPDWNDVLRLYSAHTKMFLIYNQQYTGSERTIRLADQGKEFYLQHAPYTAEFLYRTDFLEAVHTSTFRGNRSFWQWGITDQDLISIMNALGYSREWFKNFGPYGHLTEMEEHAFIFVKRP